jgi:hypothetical protein
MRTARSVVGESTRERGLLHITGEAGRTIGRVIDVLAGHLFLGEHLDPGTRKRNGDPVLLEAADLTTHDVIDEKWAAKAAAIEPIEVPLERSDIRVTARCVVWIPVG